MANNYCSVCGACGCGTRLYLVNGKHYCATHYPHGSQTNTNSKTSNNGQDSQGNSESSLQVGDESV